MGSILARLRELLEPPRRLRPTRVGTWFLVGVLVVGLAAVNTGNNLLYFVLGMMLGAIVVSGILSERNLRGIEVVRTIPAAVHAGDPAMLAYVVRAAGRRLPIVALEIRDREPGGEPGPTVRFIRIDPGATRRRAYERTFPRRGRHVLTGIEIATTFPFGLFRKSRRIPAVSEARVRPRVPDIPAPEAGTGREEGAAAAPIRGEGLELFGLREHRPGDDARWIHWKASARARQTIVKETAREEPPRVVIRLDLGRGRPAPAVERAVERAAGLAAAFAREGYGVGFSSGAVWLPPAAGAANREAILDALVDVGPLGPLDEPSDVRTFDPRIAQVRVTPDAREPGASV